MAAVTTSGRSAPSGSSTTVSSPVCAKLEALAFKALRMLEPKYPLWREFAYEYEHDRLAIDLLSGSDLLRIWVDDRGSQPKALDQLALADERAWRTERRKFLLY